MTEINFETHLIEAIQKEKIFQASFFELIGKFEEKISTFRFEENSILIDDYFNAGKGQKSILAKLLSESKVQKEYCREYLTRDGNVKYDFKGIYFFLLDNKPFYIGISKGVVGRICQHLKGKNHNTSSLAYKLGLLRYEYVNGRKHTGTRKDLNFLTEVEPVKNFLRRQRIAWINMMMNYTYLRFIAR